MRVNKIPKQWAGRVHGQPVAKRPHQSHTLGQMNKTEARWAAELEKYRELALVSHWHFEALKIRLAPNTYYTPDFVVVYPRHIEFHEVKGGFIRDTSKVKFKCGAALLPWAKFVMVQWKNNQWTKILELN